MSLMKIFQRIAPRTGIRRVVVEPGGSHAACIEFTNGKHIMFRDKQFNINASNASSIAKDKMSTHFFLKKWGFSVPRARLFSYTVGMGVKERHEIIEKAFHYAETVGLPVMLKPHDLSQGRYVTKIYRRPFFFQTARKIFAAGSSLLVERFYEGTDYRIVVFDNSVISAYQRIPLFVLGDGRATIAQLIARKQRFFKRLRGFTAIDLSDPRIQEKLRFQHHTMESIPYRGEKITLLDNSNISSGGEAVRLPGPLHPDYNKLAVAIAQSLSLRLCGIDIMLLEPERTLSDPLVRYVVLEVNAAPGLINYNLTVRETDKLYSIILKKLSQE